MTILDPWPSVQYLILLIFTAVKCGWIKKNFMNIINVIKCLNDNGPNKQEMQC